MDGNLNSMLHKFYLEKDNITNVKIAIPTKNYFSDAEKEKFENYLLQLFSDIQFELFRSRIYKENVQATRDAINHNIQYSIRSAFSTDNTHVICEAPMKFHDTDRFELTYNFNWSLSGDYCRNETLEASSKYENELSKKYEVTILSKCQQKDLPNGKLIDIVFSEEFIRLQFKIWLVTYLTDAEELTAIKLVNQILNDSNANRMIFCPFRINDERYQLNKIIDESIETDRIYLSNPTSVQNVSYAKTINDISKMYEPNSKLSRAIYILMLQKIEAQKLSFQKIVIPHYENDVHLSLAEQFVFCCNKNLYGNMNVLEETFKKLLKLDDLRDTSKNASIGNNVYFRKKSNGILQVISDNDIDNSVTKTLKNWYDLWHSEKDDNLEKFEQLVNNRGKLEFIDISTENESIIHNLDSITIRLSIDNEIDDMPHTIDDLLEQAKASFNDNISKIRSSKELKRCINSLIDEIIEVSEINGRDIYFTGIGKNQTVAEKTANSFRSLGFKAHSINPISALHGDMGMLRPGDLIVSISKSGKTTELHAFLKYIKETKPEVSLLGLQQSSEETMISKLINTICLPEVSELGDNKMVPTMSTIIMQTYLDIVAIQCAKLTRYDKTNFKENHPGGIIGQS